MTILTALADAVAARSPLLSMLGEVTYALSSGDRAKQSAHLSIETSHRSIELLLWDSGECELNYGTVESATYEHLEVRNPAEVAALVDRVLDLATPP